MNLNFDLQQKLDKNQNNVTNQHSNNISPLRRYDVKFTYKEYNINIYQRISNKSDGWNIYTCNKKKEWAKKKKCFKRVKKHNMLLHEV